MTYTIRNDSTPGYVYLIEAQNSNGLYKIGLSRNPNRRLQQLNSSQSPYYLNFVKVIEVENMASAEGYLHQQFEAYGSGKNEWFRFSSSELSRVVAEMDRIESSTSESPGRWQFNLPFELPTIELRSRFEFAALSVAGCLILWAVLGPKVKLSANASHAIVSTHSSEGCTVTAPLLNVRSGPGVAYSLSGQPLAKGTVIEKLEEADGWLRSNRGWLASNHVRC